MISFLQLLILSSVLITPRALVTQAQTKTWANKLSTKFAELLDDTMLVSKLQKIYDNTPVTVKEMQGNVEAASVAAEISSLLNNKDLTLRTFGKAVWSNADSDIQKRAEELVNILTEEGDEQILRVYLTSHKDGKTTLHSVQGRTDANEVAPTASTKGYVPISSIDPVPSFINTDVYDGRRTAWYANSIAGPKDVFLVIDETGLDTFAFEQLKQTVLYILDTISPNDNIWIQRKTKLDATSLLTPLGNETCMTGFARGTLKVVSKLSKLVKEMSFTATLASPATSSSSDWLNMVSTTFNEVNLVRNKVRNKKRAGCIVILSSGTIDNINTQNIVVPNVMKQNVHNLPIIAFYYSKLKAEVEAAAAAASSASSPVPLSYSFNDLGTFAWMRSINHTTTAALYYENLISTPENDDPLTALTPSSLHFWGGLFSHIPTIYDYGGQDGSNTPNIMTMTRSIYKYAETDSTKRSINARPLLIGVVAFDMNLRSLKNKLDTASANLGRTSFPILVTPHGETIYHQLMTRYKQRNLFDVGIDISNYEYFDHIEKDACKCQSSWEYGVPIANNIHTDGSDTITGTYVGCSPTPDWPETPWCYVVDSETCATSKQSLVESETRRWLECGQSKSFANTVRPPFLRGELGEQSLRVLRSLPGGDAATEGFAGKEIDTTYFYRTVSGWDLRLALVVDKFDLRQSILVPNSGKRMITSQLEDYIANAKNLALANLIPNLEFFNNNNCKAEGSDVAFSNCKPDAYCARVAAGTPHPVGTVSNLPPCVAASTCICEKHRWPVGLTATNAASTHIAPISLTDPQLAFDLQNGVAGIQKVDLTYEMTRFLNRDPTSSNPKQQKLRPDAIEHAMTAASITEFWISDQVKGVHENTVWLYYASNTGMSIIFPPNNWGFLWDPTRRPWYSRAIASGGRVRAAISTPYVDGGGAGLMNTLASVVWGPQQAERQITGVMGYDFLYPVMNDMVPSVSDCSNKNVRDIGQNNPRETACWLIEVSGLLLTHTDFLATKESELKEVKNYAQVENVFLGLKEPDIADVLIEAKVLIAKTSRTPDSMFIIYTYRVDETKFTATNPVISGAFNSPLSCLQAPKDGGEVKWHISHVDDSNAFLLVVDGYRRKDTECTIETKSKPSDTRDNKDIMDSCGKQQFFFDEASSWQTVCNTFLDGSVCGKCPSNSHIVSNKGPVGSACHCNANFYSQITQDVTTGRENLICKKCPDKATSSKGSTSSSDCECMDTMFKDTITALCDACPPDSTLIEGVKIGSPTDVCLCSNNYYQSVTLSTSDKSKWISATEHFYYLMKCNPCKTRSTSLKNSQSADDCKCNEGLFLDSVKLIDQSEPGCACRKSWKYSIGGVESTYNGCVETPDWRGAEWCYVEDAKCTVSLKSSVEGLTLKWMRCDTTKTCKICPPNSNLVDPMGPVQNSCACNEDYYAEITGTTMTCIKCANDKAALPGSTECKCKQGTHYLLDPKNGTCSICPPEADCSFKSNTLITEIVPKPGYWRTNFHSSLFSDCSQGHRGLNATNIAETRCCPHKNNESICKELNSSFTSDAQCLLGYSGPLCLICAEGYVDMGRECLECKDGTSFALALLPMFLMVLVLFLFLIFVFVRCTDGIDSHKKRIASTKRLKKMQKLTGQIKILLSFLQILCSMPNVLDSVEFPILFMQLFGSLGSIVNFNLTGLFSIASCRVAVPFFQKFMLHMMLPVCILLSIWCAYFVARVCKSQPVQRVHLKELACKISVMVILLIFPGLSTKIFQMWKCQTFEGIEEPLLEVDYSIKCYQGEHIKYSVLAFVFMVLFIIGIPLTMFVLMYVNRKHLHDKESEHHHMVNATLGGLFIQYEEAYWWFELVILFNKTMICGGLVVMSPGTPIQVLFAIFIMLIHLLMILKLSPYVHASEDWTSFTTTLGLFLISLFAFSMQVNLNATQKYFVDIFATVIPIICVVIVIGITVFLDCGLLKRCGCAQDTENNNKDLQIHPNNNSNLIKEDKGAGVRDWSSK